MSGKPLRECTSCKACVETVYFLRRNWRTNYWTYVSKWKEVGSGLCQVCAVASADEMNQKIKQESLQ